MRLLWVFSTFGIGGPQRRAASLIQRLGGDFDHTIIALDGLRDAEVFLPTSGWRFETLDLEKSGFVSLHNLHAIQSTLRRLAPDLLLTSNWGSIEWSFANRGRGAVPHIHFEDGFGADERPDRQALRRVLARRFALRGRNVVVPSRTLERVALQSWRLPKDEVTFVPNGVDVSAFSAVVPRQGQPSVTVGSLGALRTEKNYPRLVKSVAKARAITGADIVLRIYGEGPERAAIAGAAPDASWLKLPGATDDPCLALATFDIFALSSDTEQMPLSLIEAMAAGLPAVSTDVGDIRLMVSSQNAPYVVDPAAIDALSVAIASLATDPDLRRRIGEENAKKAKADYSLDAMCETYRSLFSRVAGRGH